MEVKCQCGDSVFKSYAGDKIKIRSRIVLIEDGITFAKCKRCGTNVEIPMKLDKCRISRKVLVPDPKLKHYVIN